MPSDQTTRASTKPSAPAKPQRLPLPPPAPSTPAPPSSPTQAEASAAREIPQAFPASKKLLTKEELEKQVEEAKQARLEHVLNLCEPVHPGDRARFADTILHLERDLPKFPLQRLGEFAYQLLSRSLGVIEPERIIKLPMEDLGAKVLSEIIPDGEFTDDAVAFLSAVSSCMNWTDLEVVTAILCRFAMTTLLHRLIVDAHPVMREFNAQLEASVTAKYDEEQEELKALRAFKKSIEDAKKPVTETTG